MSDFMLILSLLYYWPSVVTFFLRGCGSEKAKNIASCWFHRKFKLQKKIYFWPLLRQYRMY